MSKLEGTATQSRLSHGCTAITAVMQALVTGLVSSDTVVTAVGSVLAITAMRHRLEEF